MRSIQSFRTVLAIAGLIIAGSLMPASGGLPAAKAIGGQDDFDALSRETRHELTLARKATARYRDIAQAIADGYVDVDIVVPNMGAHFLKLGLLDGTFDPEKPELLIYAATRCPGDKQRLVAVEYAVPIALSATPPAGFTGDHDVWHRNETYGLWTLHAWIWYENPDGVFEDFNYRIP